MFGSGVEWSGAGGTLLACLTLKQRSWVIIAQVAAEWQCVDSTRYLYWSAHQLKGSALVLGKETLQRRQGGVRAERRRAAPLPHLTNSWML